MRSNSFRALMLGATLTGAALCAAPSAQAVVVTPADAPHVASPPFGAVAPGGLIDDEYIGFGLRFGTLVPTAVFSDPPLAWGGVNGGGIVDLLADVTGKFELPGGGTDAVTDHISVEGGFVGGPADLLLSVYDINGILLGSTAADDGVGPHSRLLMTLNIPGIHSFVVHTPTADSYGVNQIEFDDLTGVGGSPAPEPTSMALLALGAPGLLAARRRRKAAKG